MAICDLTVMGAGAFGLACAWAAARRGAKVRVIDPAGPGAGASGGMVGALAPHVPEGWDALKAFQFRSLLMAEGWWAEVAAAGGGDLGYARLGRLQAIRDDAALARARGRAAGAVAHWGGAAVWEVIPASQGGPLAPVSASGWLIRDSLSARLSPAGACAALVAAVTARGGEMLREGEAQGKVIWATGAAGLLAEGLGTAVKGQAAVLRVPGLEVAGLPQISGPSLHVVPHADGTVALGSTSEPEVAALGTDEKLGALIARARAAVPALAEAQVLRRWSGLRPRGPGRGPLLGPHPLRPGEFVANGGFKIGLGLAPLVGEVMADLVLEGRMGIAEAFLPVPPELPA